MSKRRLDEVIWCNRGWQPVYFGFCPSEGAWKREMKKFGKPLSSEVYPTTDARCTLFTSKKGNHCAIVTINPASKKNPTFIEVAGLMVHEATHIWQAIREAIGEKEPSHEFEAYSMQAIVQELLSAYKQSIGFKET